MIPVYWYSPTPGESPADKWDAVMLRRLLDGEVWRTARHRTFTHTRVTSLADVSGGAVVVFPAGIHAGEEGHLTAALAHLGWVLLILTADEGSLFDSRLVTHPQLKLWQMTPRPGTADERATYIGEGWPAACPTALAGLPADRPQPTDVFYAGQANHPRRRRLTAEVERAAVTYATDLTVTDGFAQGLPPEDYYRRLAAAKVVPCPGGPVTPDSFRAYETMEAGALPLLDAGCRDYIDAGYWDLVVPGCPAPVVGSWRDFPAVIRTALNDWPGNANAVASWWQQHKRRLAWQLTGDLGALGVPEPAPDVDDLYTVLVPTSPIPSNPSTEIIEETLGTIRERLPRSEIIVMVDGVRPAQEYRRGDYDEFTRRLLWLCAHRWDNIVPVVHGTIRHQSGMTRRAVREVHTPLVMYVEHDMPLCGDIPFADAARVLLEDVALDVLRFTYNHGWEPAHEHMRIDAAAVDMGGLPVRRTWQWSQNVHIATTAYYRTTMEQLVPDAPCFIEEALHGPVASMYLDHGMAGWARHRIAMYAPDGDPARCYHLDGRKTDPPFHGG